jgi:hypothetical protein
VPRFSSSLSHFSCLLNLHCLFKKISIVSQIDWLQRHRFSSSSQILFPLLQATASHLPLRFSSPYCTSGCLRPSMNTNLGGRQVEIPPAARAPLAELFRVREPSHALGVMEGLQVPSANSSSRRWPWPHQAVRPVGAHWPATQPPAWRCERAAMPKSCPAAT